MTVPEVMARAGFERKKGSDTIFLLELSDDKYILAYVSDEPPSFWRINQVEKIEEPDKMCSTFRASARVMSYYEVERYLPESAKEELIYIMDVL